MKNIFFKLLLLIFISSATACYDYESQFEGPYSEEVGIPAPDFPRELVYVASGNVYFTNALVEDSIVIDDSGMVEIASINAAHTKILFKRADENIQIYDVEDERITGEIANSEEAIWFDYHANDETIFYLIDNDLHTQGPAVLDEQPKDLRDFFALNVEIKAAVITKDGDIVFTSTVFGIFNTDYLIRTDGSDDSNENKYQYEIPTAFVDLRINSSDNQVVGRSNSGLSNMIVFSPRSTGFDRITSALFGAPAEDFDERYEVLNDRISIRTPRIGTVQTNTGIITSIDF